MSIKSPNYGLLPSRQAELRREFRAKAKEAETTPVFEPEPSNMGSAGRKTPPKRALCHSRRAAVNSDGLCRHCLTAKITRANKADIAPEEALALQKAGGLEKLGAETLAYLRQNLPEYARQHLEASRVAALKGDTKPAEWALTNVRVGDSPVIVPVAKDGGGGGGVKVLIALQVGGLPPGTAQEAITISPVPTTPVGDTE